MKSFKDNAGRTWTVAIHVTAVRRCRALVGVDLPGLIADGFKPLGELLGDPVKLVDVLYVLCRDEADKLGITDEDFGAAMAGDAIDHATQRFLEELTDFFPDPRVRAEIGKMIRTMRTATDRLMEHLSRQVDAIDVDTEVANLIASSASLPAGLAASTPDPSPSASLP